MSSTSKGHKITKMSAIAEKLVIESKRRGLTLDESIKLGISAGSPIYIAASTQKQKRPPASQLATILRWTERINLQHTEFFNLLHHYANLHEVVFVGDESEPNRQSGKNKSDAADKENCPNLMEAEAEPLQPGAATAKGIRNDMERSQKPKIESKNETAKNATSQRTAHRPSSAILLEKHHDNSANVLPDTHKTTNPKDFKGDTNCHATALITCGHSIAVPPPSLSLEISADPQGISAFNRVLKLPNGELSQMFRNEITEYEPHGKLLYTIGELCGINCILNTLRQLSKMKEAHMFLRHLVRSSHHTIQALIELFLLNQNVTRYQNSLLVAFITEHCCPKKPEINVTPAKPGFVSEYIVTNARRHIEEWLDLLDITGVTTITRCTSCKAKSYERALGYPFHLLHRNCSCDAIPAGECSKHDCDGLTNTQYRAHPKGLTISIPNHRSCNNHQVDNELPPYIVISNKVFFRSAILGTLHYHTKNHAMSIIYSSTDGSATIYDDEMDTPVPIQDWVLNIHYAFYLQLEAGQCPYEVKYLPNGVKLP